MKKRNRARLFLEHLEDRLVPAFNFTTDLSGNLSVTGCADFDATNPTPGSSDSVTINEISPNTFSFTETPFVGAPVVILANIQVLNSLTVDFSQCNLNDNLTINLNGNSLNGSLTVREGLGNDSLTLSGGGGNIGGNVSLTNTNNVTLGSFAAADTLNIGGNFALYNGQKHLFTSLLSDGGIRVGGNVTITVGNASSFLAFGTINGPDSVGGNMFVSTGNGALNSLNLPVGTVVGGSLTYLGGSGDDVVTAAGTIGKSVYANLGGGSPAGNNFTQGATAVFGSSLTVLGGTGGNTIILNGQTGGSAYFNLGIGQRTLIFNTGAQIDGPSISYFATGSGTNNILFNGLTPRSNAFFTLGNSADTFTLGAAANLASLYIDFGLDAPGTHDTFNNMSGFNQPRLNLRNLG